MITREEFYDKGRCLLCWSKNLHLYQTHKNGEAYCVGARCKDCGHGMGFNRQGIAMSTSVYLNQPLDFDETEFYPDEYVKNLNFSSLKKRAKELYRD